MTPKVETEKKKLKCDFYKRKMGSFFFWLNRQLSMVNTQRNRTEKSYEKNKSGEKQILKKSFLCVLNVVSSKRKTTHRNEKKKLKQKTYSIKTEK